jgi:hypothetical protein
MQPYMIPFAVTIDEAAAPPASLDFMFWGAGLFVFPLMLFYTVTRIGNPQHNKREWRKRRVAARTCCRMRDRVFGPVGEN